jgi:hypothetical protein
MIEVDENTTTADQRPSTRNRTYEDDDGLIQIPQTRHRRFEDGLEEPRSIDKDGDVEMSPLMEVRMTETVETQYIEHREQTLRETYIEPVQVFPILREPRLDEKRTGGLNEELVSKAMNAENG